MRPSRSRHRGSRLGTFTRGRENPPSFPGQSPRESPCFQRTPAGQQQRPQPSARESSHSVKLARAPASQAGRAETGRDGHGLHRPGSRAVISSRALREGQSGNPGRRHCWGRAPRGPVSGAPGPAGVHRRPQSAGSPPCSRVPAPLREARAS